MAMFANPTEAAAAFKAALKVRNPSANDLEIIRAAIDQIVASPGNASFLPDLTHPIQGENFKQQQRNAAYWMQRYAKNRGIALSDDFPEGVPYGQTAAKTAAPKTLGGQAANPIVRSSLPTPGAVDPVVAQAEAAATAAGRPNFTTAEQNAALLRQLSADQVAEGFAAERAGTGTFLPPTRAPSRLIIPRPSVAPSSPGTFTSLEENLASQLAGAAEGQVASAARIPAALPYTGSLLPEVTGAGNLVGSSQSAARGLGFGPALQSADEVLAANRGSALTSQGIDDAARALAGQAAKAEGAIAGLDDVALSAVKGGLGWKGGLAAGIGLPIAGQLASGILQSSATNDQGEVSDFGRVGGGALRGAGLGAGLGATLGAPLFGIGAVPGGLIGAGLGAVGGGLWEGLFGHDQSHSFEDQLANAQTQVMSAIPANLDAETRSALTQYLQLQFQFASTPDQVKAILTDAPKQIAAAMAQSQTQRQQQARLASSQAILAPLLTKLYDTSTRESQLSYDRGLRSADALSSIDPGLAALARERATLNRTNSLDQTSANAAMLASYPAAQQFDLLGNINQQVQGGLTGRIAQQIVNQYMPTATANTGLTG